MCVKVSLTHTLTPVCHRLQYWLYEPEVQAPWNLYRAQLQRRRALAAEARAAAAASAPTTILIAKVEVAGASAAAFLALQPRWQQKMAGLAGLPPSAVAVRSGECSTSPAAITCCSDACITSRRPIPHARAAAVDLPGAEGRRRLQSVESSLAVYTSFVCVE